MYNSRLGEYIDKVFTCNSCKELIDVVLQIEDRLIQTALIEFQGEELIDGGFIPSDEDVKYGKFIVYHKHGLNYGTYVFLLGPEIDGKFNLYIFGDRFHIDQTQCVIGIPARVRQELDYTLCGIW